MKKHPYDFAKQEAPDAEARAAEGEGGAENGADFVEHRKNPPNDSVDERCSNCDASEEAAQRALAEAEEMRLRALAEADNARKRFLREKDEAIRYAATGVLSEIIPALDNMDLALEHGKKNEACKDFYVGVEMTYKLLLAALQKHGLSQVGAVGEEFDPAVHEAVSMAPDENVPNGAVCALLNRGYKLHERLLRPAKVIVCKK